MTDFSTLERLDRVKEMCELLGFKIIKSNFFSSQNLIGLKPKNRESFPIYNEHAELFYGTLEEIYSWLNGILWSRNYDKMLLGNTMETKRKKAEQDILNKRLITIIKGSEKNDV